MNADGTNVVNVSSSTNSDQFADVPANGGELAIESRQLAVQDPSLQIYRLSIDGSSRVQLTTGAFGKYAPRWGLGEYGSHIVFLQGQASGGPYGIRIIEPSGQVRLITSPMPTEIDGPGDIFLDHHDNRYKVIFSRFTTTSGEQRLMIIDADAPGPVSTVTSDKIFREMAPSVSHDGQVVAYRVLSTSPSLIEGVRVVRTRDWQQVSAFDLPIPQQVNIKDIGWSRSDTRLYVAFEFADVTVEETRDRTEIVSVKLDGSDPRRITNNRVADHSANGVPCMSFWRWLCFLIDLGTDE